MVWYETPGSHTTTGWCGILVVLSHGMRFYLYDPMVCYKRGVSCRISCRSTLGVLFRGVLARIIARIVMLGAPLIVLNWSALISALLAPNECRNKCQNGS